MNELYVAVDGDNVGSRLEYWAITNNTGALTEFSTQFNVAMHWFEQQLIINFDANVIFNGGDNLLASMPVNRFNLGVFEQLRIGFAGKANSTLSVGLGMSPRNAYLALKLAKTGGKNSVRNFEELAHD